MTSAAQLVLLGYDRPGLEPGFRALLERHPVAGVVLSGEALGPPEQVRSLTAELQALAPRGLPFLIAVAQEGGRGQSWGPPHQEALPSAAEIGWDAETSGETFEVTLRAVEAGRRLAGAGINLNLAPVLDLGSRSGSPAGDRSFGARPEGVAEVGGAWIEGFQAAGVLACGKHFPGLGGAELDDRLGLYAVRHDAERLEDELLPFRAAISRGLEIVLIAHALYPAWDRDRPASLSPAIVRDLLRGELGFEGVVLTAELGSPELRARHDLLETGLLALDAGCDVLLSAAEPHRREELLEGLEEARRDGRLRDERVRESVHRIATVKLDWLVDA